MFTPKEIAENNIRSGIAKANLPLGKMILLGILAGAFIALAATNSLYLEQANKLYGITAEQCLSLTHFHGIESFLFVTVGNILGGMVCVALVYYMVYKKEWK